ncbi:MAG: indolepyruvate oxidoreductase subunit beta [Nitrososphaerales archaeon]|nr:indolepyruvate oxidoreductase subunit beta [Nitrososphaerales archaeon]
MKEFNIIITGVGGQGVLTLTNVITWSALKEGLDVKASELHGLAQRSGAIACHVRFGNRIYSPLVLEGKADLIFGLEPLEALRSCYFGSRNRTIFLVNTHRVIPSSIFITKEEYPSLSYIVKALRPFSDKVITLDASEVAKNGTGDVVMANMYMLGYACAKNLIQLKKESILDGMKEVIPERHIKSNIRILNLGFKAK